MLDDLTSDDFKPLVNDVFEMSCEGASIKLTLSTVDVMDERYSRPDARLSFSLTFMGPMEPLLPQGPYTLRHDTLGALELFAVPLGPVDEGQRYEIIFN